MQQPEWLFIGVYPNAYIYADKSIYNSGDYHEIARIYFRPLEIVIMDCSKKYADIHDLANAAYNKIMDNIGEPIEVSATGQTVQPYLA